MDTNKEKTKKTYKGKFIFVTILLIISMILNVVFIIQNNSIDYTITYNGIETTTQYSIINIEFNNKLDSAITLSEYDFSIEYNGERITAYKLTDINGYSNTSNLIISRYGTKKYKIYFTKLDYKNFTALYYKGEKVVEL